ncbi:MAG: hypothetical protein C4339_03730 [Nitrososphaerota archaeon]
MSAEAPAYRKLYRSSRDRILAGVCGGLGEYLNVDPVVIRLATVGLFLLAPVVVGLLYLVAAFIVPKRPGEGEAQRAPAVRPLGLVIVALLIALSALLGFLSFFSGWFFISGILICPGGTCISLPRWLFVAGVSGLLLVGAVLVALAALLYATRPGK